jgi:hypothetical protein
LIKKMEDWNFIERQVYARGYLKGIVLGFILTINLIMLGYDIYLIFR